jgi:hypothetical protein
MLKIPDATEAFYAIVQKRRFQNKLLFNLLLDRHPA